MKDILFNPFEKQLEFLESVFSGMYNFVLYGGGIRRGKTYAGIGVLIMLCRLYPKSRWAIMRKDMPTIERNIYPSWEKICPIDFVSKDRRSATNNPRVEFKNKSIILFFPENYAKDKELNRLKGLEVNGFLADEINELQEVTFDKMIERAGSYIIKNGKQPNPIVLGTCNPSPVWVKKRIYTPHKEGKLKPIWKYIHTSITDNPYNSKEYLESLKSLPHYHYRIYVEGDWDFQAKSPNAYWRSFDLDKHLSNELINTRLPIHVSVDSNVLPYIAVSVWQMPNPNTAIQIGEIAAEDPNNTVQKAAELVNDYLNSINHNDTVILHGDATAKARNTIDPEKKSFIKLFKAKLDEQFIVVNKVSSSNPSVTLRGEFLNLVYERKVGKLNIKINENCKESINDYITVLQDMNGGMLKKKITKDGLTYEPNGHFSDTKAYFLCDIWKQQYNEFKNAGSMHNYILKVQPSHNVM